MKESQTPDELPIIDFNALTQLVGNNPELAKEMLKAFMEELPKAQEQISQAFQSKDWDVLQHHMHRLHGALAYSGALRLKETVVDFEKALISKTNHYDELYQRLNNYIKLTMQAYEEIH